MSYDRVVTANEMVKLGQLTKTNLYLNILIWQKEQ